jgi:hypothetical protein
MEGMQHGNACLVNGSPSQPRHAPSPSRERGSMPFHVSLTFFEKGIQEEVINGDSFLSFYKRRGDLKSLLVFPSVP